MSPIGRLRRSCRFSDCPALSDARRPIVRMADARDQHAWTNSSVREGTLARCLRSDGPGDPAVSRIVLLSPMLGVQSFAWLTRVISMLGPIPAFEKARWLDVSDRTAPAILPFLGLSCSLRCSASNRSHG